MIFKDYILKEVEARKVGIFPGAFKPPHIGHYNAAKKASMQCDEVHVFISAQPRDMITAEISKAIWDIFARTLPNVIAAVSPTTPVKDTYDLIGKLNESPEAANYAAFLYADPDDMPRFDRVDKFAKNLATVRKVATDRSLSASKIREAISANNWKFVASCYPPNIDINKVLRLLKFKS